jgi:hypothetical protein
VKGLAEHELLPLWEEGESAGRLGRAAALLAAAAPDLGAEELGELTVGERDAALLALHARTFAGRLEGFVRCPVCDEALEVELGETHVRAILDKQPQLGEHELAVEGFELRFRPITCADLEAAARAADADAARRVLVERAVVAATRDGEPVEPAALGEEVVTTLAERLVACDPQAEITLAVTCPECEHAWRAVIDVTAFLWSEVSLAARRVFEEVHILAGSYGWTEAEVLALSRRRRRLYLELAAS